jgi:glycosyltransferase involved in cell wall biosynthesis
MPTLSLDATYSVGQNLSGVGVYSREILDHLARAHPEARFLQCYRPHRFTLSRREAAAPNVHRRLLLPPLYVPAGDLFHGLNQRLPTGRLNRAVSTFHDLFVLGSDYSTAEFRKRFAALARDAAARSDLIITVSQYTADQVTSRLGVAPERTRVVPHGVRFPPAGIGAPRRKAVLHVGAIQRRKNIARLVAAFERAAPAPWRLVLAGSLGFEGEEILARIEGSRVRDRIDIKGWVDDEQLAALYRECAFLAFPSLEEGFGIPALEAMAQGMPVLASRAGALPEVCGDAALLVDPLSEDEISEGMRRLIAEDGLGERLATRGRERAGDFSWESAAARTWAVYEELL